MEYNKNIRINILGRDNFLPFITIEQMFDFGIMQPGDHAYVSATYNDEVIEFEIVVSINQFVEEKESEIDKEYGDRIKITPCETDRNDYLFYIVTWYNIDNGQNGIDEYDDCKFVASFLPNSNRKFGYSYFRTISEIVRYIKAVDGNADKIIWEDSAKNNISINDLYNLSIDMGINFILELNTYHILNRNEEYVFRVVNRAHEDDENLGCLTIEDAVKKFNIDREQVYEYECMECGIIYYGQWHSKYSDPEYCPICDCKDALFIKPIRYVGYSEC